MNRRNQDTRFLLASRRGVSSPGPRYCPISGGDEKYVSTEPLTSIRHLREKHGNAAHIIKNVRARIQVEE